MDQAKTLRKLLGQARPVITPILGDLQQDYAACLGRFILEQQARLGANSLLLDGSERGLNALVEAGPQQDLLGFLQGRRNLEDLTTLLAKQQYLVPARLGLSALGKAPAQAQMLLGKLHRLPVTCDHLYATLDYTAHALAHAFSEEGEWLWIVQPTAQSVTQVYSAIRSSGGVSEFVQHRVIVAGVRSVSEADHVFANLQDTTARFLGKPLQYGGHLPILKANQPLSEAGREMIAAGRRVAKAVCTAEDQAYA